VSDSKKRRRSWLAPLAVLGVGWAIRKTANQAQKKISKRRDGKPEPKHEEFIWKVMMTVLLAAAEALVNSFMTKQRPEESIETLSGDSD